MRCQCCKQDYNEINHIMVEAMLYSIDADCDAHVFYNEPAQHFFLCPDCKKLFDQKLYEIRKFINEL